MRWVGFVIGCLLGIPLLLFAVMLTGWNWVARRRSPFGELMNGLSAGLVWGTDKLIDFDLDDEKKFPKEDP
mgnify:FL=1